MNTNEIWVRVCKLYQKLNLSKFATALKLVTPRVITRLDGGLASQMWQFALGYTVARKLGLPLEIDTHWFSVSGYDISGKKNRQFLLWDTFPELKERYAQAELPGANDSRKFKMYHSDAYSDRPFYEYREEEFFAKRPHYIDAYHAGYAHVRHYKNELVKLFRFGVSLTPEEEKAHKQIKGTESCALHLRRGDFVGSCYDVCTEYYYLQAIKRMRELLPEVQIFVFSNDETYADYIVQQAGGEDFMHVFRGRNEEDPRVDMYLISECKHAIISNSAFSAFPTWLSYGADSVVMRPSYWRLGDLKEPMKDVYMEEGWLKIPLSADEEQET